MVFKPKVGLLLSIGLATYVLFFWSFMVIDGQLLILHKRQPSLKNIVVVKKDRIGILAALAIESQYNCAILTIGKNGFYVLRFSRR